MKRREDYQHSNRSSGRFSLGGMFGFVVVVGVMYFLVLGPDHNVLSLDTLIKWIDHLTRREQLVAISLIPIYLSCLIFGGGMVGGWFGHRVHRSMFGRQSRHFHS